MLVADTDSFRGMSVNTENVLERTINLSMLTAGAAAAAAAAPAPAAKQDSNKHTTLVR
jgi:hypothetical protein